MPTQTQATTALRDALAALYPTRADAERIVTDADLKLTAIAFNDKAMNTWHSILSEADKHGKVVQIIALALAAYATNGLLQQASAAYLTATGQTLPPAVVPPQQPAQPVSRASPADQQARQDLLKRHQRNLQLLQAKQAVYAVGEEPLSLLNQIEHEEQAIQELKQQLDQ